DEQAEESRRRHTHELAVVCRDFLHRLFTLWDDMPGRATAREHIARTRRFATELGLFRDEDRDALDCLFAELDQWSASPGVRPLDRRAFTRRLAILAAEATLPSPPVDGCVRIVSAETARHRTVAHRFVLNLAERTFPRLSAGPDLLEGDREAFG